MSKCVIQSVHEAIFASVGHATDRPAWMALPELYPYASEACTKLETWCELRQILGIFLRRRVGDLGRA